MPELSWRVVYFLLQAHMRQIVASRQLRPLLDDILQAYEDWQEEEKKVMGSNLAGLSIMSREARENESGGYLDGEEAEEDVAKGRKKRAFANVA